LSYTRQRCQGYGPASHLLRLQRRPGSSSIWLHMAPSARAASSPPTPAPPRLRPSNSSTMPTASSTKPISSSSSRRHRLQPRRWQGQDKDFWGIDQDVKSLASSSPPTSAATAVGTLPNSSSAKATAPSAPPPSAIISSSTTECISTASTSSPRFSISHHLVPARQRHALHLLPSQLRRHRFLSQNAQGPARRPQRLPRRSPPVCLRRIRYSPDERRNHFGSRQSRHRRKKFRGFTGLSDDYIIKADLRVNLPQFHGRNCSAAANSPLDASTPVSPVRRPTCSPNMPTTIPKHRRRGSLSSRHSTATSAKI